MQLSAIFPSSGDSVVAWDAGLRRASVFSLGGGFGRTIRLDPALAGARLAGVTGTGHLLVIDMRYDGAGDGEVTRLREERFLYDADGQRVDSLGSAPGMLGAVRTTGSGMSLRPALFRLSTNYAVAGDLLWIQRSDLAGLEVQHIGRDGLAAITWREPRIATTEEHASAFISERLRGMTDPDQRRAMRRDFETRPRPDSLPTTTDVVADASGAAWVARVPSTRQWRLRRVGGDPRLGRCPATRSHPSRHGIARRPGRPASRAPARRPGSRVRASVRPGRQSLTFGFGPPTRDTLARQTRYRVGCDTRTPPRRLCQARNPVDPRARCTTPTPPSNHPRDARPASRRLRLRRLQRATGSRRRARPARAMSSMEPELIPLGRKKEPEVFGPRYVDPGAVAPLMERELTRGQVTETGRVTVRIQVSVTGSIESREIISNTAGNKLGRAAMDIARQLKFHPAERAGCAIPSLVDFELATGARRLTHDSTRPAAPARRRSARAGRGHCLEQRRGNARH